MSLRWIALLVAMKLLYVNAENAEDASTESQAPCAPNRRCPAENDEGLNVLQLGVEKNKIHLQEETYESTNNKAQVPACRGNKATWNAGWGLCATYSGRNAAYCKHDRHNNLLAAEVCSECGLCQDVPACRGERSTWNAGWGMCASYSDFNAAYCQTDRYNNLFAAEVCSECGRCEDESSPTPMPLPTIEPNTSDQHIISLPWNNSCPEGYGDEFEAFACQNVAQQLCPSGFKETLFSPHVPTGCVVQVKLPGLECGVFMNNDTVFLGPYPGQDASENWHKVCKNKSQPGLTIEPTPAATPVPTLEPNTSDQYIVFLPFNNSCPEGYGEELEVLACQNFAHQFCPSSFVVELEYPHVPTGCVVRVKMEAIPGNECSVFMNYAPVFLGPDPGHNATEHWHKVCKKKSQPGLTIEPTPAATPLPTLEPNTSDQYIVFSPFNNSCPEGYGEELEVLACQNVAKQFCPSQGFNGIIEFPHAPIGCVLFVYLEGDHCAIFMNNAPVFLGPFPGPAPPEHFQKVCKKKSQPGLTT